ncbi:cobalamin biosynthesis protein [Billgrantia sp. Q4P2]|uniref:cobalamin biosynthesis protein n=1 Tax=Billgrantia sp. Q4P2 TaxID=3463857 RepID=UPI0040569913
MRVAGFGFRREAQLASLVDALEQLEAQHGSVDRLAVTQAMWPLVQELGRARGLAVIPVADAALPTVTTITHSRHSLQARGTGSVAEAVALLAAGPGAELLGPRLISADRLATAAVARGALIGDRT